MTPSATMADQEKTKNATTQDHSPAPHVDELRKNQAKHFKILSATLKKEPTPPPTDGSDKPEAVEIYTLDVLGRKIKLAGTKLKIGDIKNHPGTHIVFEKPRIEWIRYFHYGKHHNVLRDEEGKTILEDVTSGSLPWSEDKGRDKNLKDIFEYKGWKPKAINLMLKAIRTEYLKNEDIKTNYLPPQMAETQYTEASDDDKKSTKTISITASDVVSLIEWDIFKSDLKNRMFSVDGRPYLLLPHCDGVYEKDELGMSNFVEMSVNDTTNRLYPLLSKESEPLRAELQRLCWAKHGLTCQDARIKEAIMLMQGHANKNKKIAVNRIHYLNKALYYDPMLEENNKIIKLTKDGWEILPDTSMMNPDDDRFIFMRYPHQMPQVMPSRTGDITLLNKYYDLRNEEATLFMVKDTHVDFFPQIRRALKQLEGPHGNGKSFRVNTMVSLIDPSDHEEGYPLDKKTKNSEVIRWLHQGYFVAFDNVSEITKSQNDILAQGVSGLSQSTRSLYTNDDSFAYPTFKRAIAISGITVTGTEADVLDRTYGLEVPMPKKKVSDEDLVEQFEKDKPHILGAIFDNLCKALSYVDDMKNIEIPDTVRLRDYAIYGCAISKAMGYEPEDFLNYYMSTFEDRDFLALESNVLGTALMEYMYMVGHFMGNLDELMTHLEITIRECNLHITADYPMNSKGMGIELKNIEKNLEAVGIKVAKGKRINNKRIYVISYKDFVPNSTRKNPFAQDNNTVDQIVVNKTPADPNQSSAPDATVDDKISKDIGGIKVFA
jgi:hypothetical protein